MRVLAPWRQRAAAVAPGGAAADEGQPLEVARKSAAAGAVGPGEAAQPLYQFGGIGIATGMGLVAIGIGRRITA